MRYIELGKSGIKVSLIGYGAWKISKVMWDGVDDKSSLYAMDCAIDYGVNYFDTAPAYGYGHSEEMVAKILKGRRDKIVVATKVGKRWDDRGIPAHLLPKNSQLKITKTLKKESVLWEIDQSLKRLHTDYIDLIQIHWHDGVTPLEEPIEAFLKAQKAGKIRAFGVCNLGLNSLKIIQKIADLASVQGLYNLIDRNTELFLGNHLEYRTEDELLPFCRENQISLIPYCPLARSWLTEQRDPAIPKDYPIYWDESEREAKFALREKYLAEAHERGLTLSAYALRWLASREGVGPIIIGSTNPEHIIENIRAVE